MDRSLLNAQVASCLAEVAPATGSWVWVSPDTLTEVAIVGLVRRSEHQAPEITGVPDRRLELVVATSTLPDPRPGANQHLVRDGLRHRIIEIWAEEPGLTVFVLEGTGSDV